MSFESMKRTSPRINDIFEREEAEILDRAAEKRASKKQRTRKLGESALAFGYADALNIVSNMQGKTQDFDLAMRAVYGEKPSNPLSHEMHQIFDQVRKISSKDPKLDLPFVYVPAKSVAQEPQVGVIFTPFSSINEQGEAPSTHNFMVQMGIDTGMAPKSWTTYHSVGSLTEIVRSTVCPEFLTLEQKTSQLELKIPLAKTVLDPESATGVRAKSSEDFQLLLGYTEISEHAGAFDSETNEKMAWLMKYTMANEKIYDPANS